MKRLTAIASAALAGLVALTGLPSIAQHGAAHGGGFAARSAPPMRSAPAARPSAPFGYRSSPSYRPSQAYRGIRPNAPVNGYRGGDPGYGRPSYGYPGQRPDAPGSYVRRAINPYQPYRNPVGDRRPRRPYRGGYGIVYGGGYSVWPAPYYLGDPYFYDNDYGYGDGYDDSGYGNSIDYGDASGAPYPPDGSGYAPPPQDGYPPDPNSDPNSYAPGYGQPQPGYSDPGYNGPGYNQPGYATPQYGPNSQPAYRPDYQPSPNAPRPAASLVNPVNVILVYKDGRSEQIHNFLLSRDSITVWDHSQREIPLDQLDIAATEKANRNAGVDFRLPTLQ